MKTKSFDCVRMKREGAERLLRQLESLTPEERRAFWEERYQRLRERQQQRKQGRVSQRA
ncbi:MAG: hypothetical protein KatS3mg022_3466 [Armatimonadota bacterium]|nr:MAG: hypothetical protein KatS3mg022_3466 [Armatimonadota bacterium]